MPDPDVYLNCFCCLVTGEIMQDLGNQYAILMGSRGGLSSVIGSQLWRMYVTKKTWEDYLEFCKKENYPLGEGPFQWNARTLPIDAGGTGRLSDLMRVAEILDK